MYFTFSSYPAKISSKFIGRNWNLDKPTSSLASELHFDSQTKAILWLSFRPFFWTKKLAGTGIEPATQGFSDLWKHFRPIP